MLNSEWKNDKQLLIEEFRNGNTEAFQYIYNLHYTTLCSFANKLINDLGEAEDIVSESFIKLWDRRHSFETVAHIRSFLYTVIRNACFDFLKAVQRKEESHKQILYLAQQDEEAYIQANMIKAEILNKVLAEVENMPERRRKIFLMAFVHGMSTAEIAQKLNITEETVRGQKARAVKLLKNILGDKGFSTGVAVASLSLLKLILDL